MDNISIDAIIAALLLSSWLLFVAGRAGVRRKKRTRSTQAGGINKRKFFSQ